MSITESKLEKVHIFPSENSYKTNINSVGENDLALVPIDNIVNEIRSDIQNVSARPYITETWKSDDGTAWYRKWSDGWIEQGGILYLTTTSANVQITLNHAMSNTDYVALCSIEHSSALSALIGVYSKTTTSFYMRSITSGGTASDSKIRNWYAFGY